MKIQYQQHIWLHYAVPYGSLKRNILLGLHGIIIDMTVLLRLTLNKSVTSPSTVNYIPLVHYNPIMHCKLVLLTLHTKALY